MELKRDEIIKGLECCINDATCEQCNLSPFTCHIQEDALSLIKELTEKNKSIAEECCHLLLKVKKLTEENERLRASSVDYRNIPDIIAETKADTVREMIDMFAMHFGTYTEKDSVKVLEVIRLLNKFAEEMSEGTK